MLKLRYMFTLKTNIKKEKYDSHKNLSRTLANNEAEFLFDDEHNLVGLNIFIPNVKARLNTKSELAVSLDEDNWQKAYSVVSHIADRFFDLTGISEFSLKEIPRYLPETQEETKLLEGKVYAKLKRSISLEVTGYDDILSEAELNKYKNQKDPYAMFVDAKRMTYPPGKYHEFFRVIEHFFPFEGTTFDLKVHNYLSNFDIRYTEECVRGLRLLRHRCSHGKKLRDYITSNDYKGIIEIQGKISDISLAARILLENPPQKK